MASPVRLTNPLAPERDKKPLKVDIPKELNSAERRAFDLTKQFSQSISEMAAHPIRQLSFDDSSPWDLHKLLVRRGEDYSQHLLDQNCRTAKEKQEAVAEVSQKVRRGLAELDAIREEENKGLTKKIIDCNKEFGKKVKDLERSIAKQIEKMKQELMQSIRNEEKESEQRICERSKRLIEEVVPPSVKESFRALRPNSASNSPAKAYKSTPEKKIMGQLAMKKLEESRGKIKQLHSQDFVMTPVKDSEAKSISSPLIEHQYSGDFEI